MVYIKALKEEILDYNALDIQSPLYVIGAGNATLTTTLTLFDKGDVLINKIEKLPIFKGVSISFFFNPAIFDRMIASALEVVMGTIRIYNGPLARNDLIITKNCYVMVQTAGAGAQNIFIENLDQLEITALLNNQLTIIFDLNSDDVVGGADFPAGYIVTRLVMEIDWVKVTTDELKDYAVEQLYVA